MKMQKCQKRKRIQVDEKYDKVNLMNFDGEIA
jgi:hypothetical protein